jgi:hypothetical protein
MLIILGSVVGLTFFFLFVLVIAQIRKKQTQALEQTREQARHNSNSVQARVVEARRAEIQYDREVETYQILLEVQPAQAAPFSAAVVWEVKPSAVSVLKAGSFIPVKVNAANAREVFPDIPGAVYSYRFQNKLLWIENEFQPEQIIRDQGVAPLGPKPNTIYRKRSQTRLFGLPLWEIAFNLKKSRGRVASAKARAVIAIGDSATGFIAIGMFAKGVVSIGILSLGLFSVGGLSLGVFSYGTQAIGLVAIGCLAGGLLSIGAISGGYFSFGPLALGKYVFTLGYQNSLLNAFYQNLKQFSGLSDGTVNYTLSIMLIIGMLMFVIILVVRAVVTGFLKPNHNSIESPARI